MPTSVAEQMRAHSQGHERVIRQGHILVPTHAGLVKLCAYKARAGISLVPTEARTTGMMEMILLTALLGLCVGSLLNVVVYRLPRMILHSGTNDFNLWLPASHCPHCKTPLCWYEKIPLLSWLLLQARCRHCQAAISWRYPLTELGCALISLLLAIMIPAGGVLLAALILCWILLALALIDREHQLLPDELTLLLLWLGLIFHLCQVLTQSSLSQAVLGAICGYLSLRLLAESYRLICGKDALGLGDAKLLAALGAWLGWQSLPLILLLASGSGIIWLCAARIICQRSLREPFPFGPCLALAGAGVFLSHYSSGWRILCQVDIFTCTEGYS